jgi:two-component system chemotaxis response regulator CheY
MPAPLILAVDDEALMRWNAERLLSEAGYRVMTAENGEDCIAKFECAGEDGVALVILDYRMPVMDGVETFRRLKQINPKVRVIVCSASVEEERLQEVVQAGDGPPISKPYSRAQFLEAVRTALG